MLAALPDVGDLRPDMSHSSICEVPSEWHGNRVHAAAVAIAPRHYSVVRLHRGIIRGALLGRDHVVIQRTRYFDFGQQPAWHGLRQFG